MQNVCECVVCGKEFKPLSQSKPNKYCSMACYRIAQRRGDYLDKRRAHDKKCAYCGKEVFRSYCHKRNGEKGGLIFCNRTCYDKYREIGRVKTCPTCGKDFFASRTQTGIYCSDECWRRHTLDISLRFCVVCGQMFVPWSLNHKKDGYILKGSVTTCSKQCARELHARNEEIRRDKISLAFTGEKHPLWLGGRNAFRGVGWDRTRRIIRRRDGVCQRCGMTENQSLRKYGERLEVHHLTPYRKFGSYAEANNEENLVALCKSCHRRVDAEYQRGEKWSQSEA